MLAWVCNPYYHYFCGATYCQHQPPIKPITVERWPKLLGQAGLAHLYASGLDTALSIGAVEVKTWLVLALMSALWERILLTQ